MAVRKKVLHQRVTEYLRTQDILPSSSGVLLAVSGGSDSLAMMHCMVHAARVLDLELVVGHVDHGLRRQSHREVFFVKERASELGLSFVSRRIDVRAQAGQGRQTIEEAARRLRYQALEEMARQAGLEFVATGHTATDQAETVLMRLIRGTGVLGLAGIEAQRPDGVVRPMLCATRKECMDYVRGLGIPYLEDPSNRSPRFLRNRVRARLLPLLLEENPRVEHLLASLAQEAAQLRSLVCDLVQSSIEWTGPQSVRVEIARASARRPVLASYAVLKAFEMVTKRPLGLSRTHVESVVRAAGRGTPSTLSLPRGVVARTSEGQAILEVAGSTPMGNDPRQS